MNPWLGIGLVLAVLGGLIVALRLFQVRFAPHPELVRKLLHVSMGLVTLSFPWLFQEIWPVWVLAGGAIAALLTVRGVRVLRCGVGQVLGGVGRTSLGEVYFPLGVALVFTLAATADAAPRHRLLLYVVPILCLTLADAVAALVGIRFGRLRYPTAEGHKSVEGSLAFFGMAFCGSYGPLVTWGGLEHPEVFLIALLLALLAMMVEAAAWGGLDNLILPLASYLLLGRYLRLPTQALVDRLWVAAGLALVALFHHRRTTLVGSALPGAVLVGYLSWALGGWAWLLPPLLFFLSYTLLAPYAGGNVQAAHNVGAVVSVTSAGLAWLFLQRILDLPGLLAPFTLAFAAHFAIIAVVRLRRGYAGLSPRAASAAGVGVGWVLWLVCALPVLGVGWRLLGHGLLALIGVSFAAWGFSRIQGGLDDCPASLGRWVRQALCGAAGSLFALPPLFWP